MSIQFKKASSSTANIVIVTLLLIVAVASLAFSINPKLFSWISNLAQVAATSHTIYDGESALLAQTCLENATLNTAGAIGTPNSITLSPTQWAGGMIKLNASCDSAQNFNNYAKLEFYIRSDSATADPLTLYLHTYDNKGDGTGVVADSAPKTISGIGSGWTLISIPISEFVANSSAWDLRNVQEIRFKETPNTRAYYIDSIVLKPADVTTIATPSPTATVETARVLPWTGPASVAAGSSMSYTLNWNGPTVVSTPTPGAWTIFVHFEKQGGGYSFPANGDFLPNPSSDKWSANMATPAPSFGIPGDAPAGTYNVYVGLYAGGTRDTLQYSSPVTSDGASRYLVGTFNVTSATTPAPIISAFTASKTSVTTGGTVTLTWSSTNATSCTASGGWGGTKAISGSEVVTPATSPVTSYGLTCSGAAGTTAAIAPTIQVGVTTPTVTPAPVALNIYDGETKKFSYMENAVEVTGGGYGGTNGLKLNTNRNATPLLRTFGAFDSNLDLSSYGSLQFYVKTDSLNPTSQIYFYTYANAYGGNSGVAASNKITLKSYIAGGVVNGNWNLVTIPLSLFKTSTWNLSNVDEVRFADASVPSKSVVLYMDSMSVTSGSVVSAAPVISAISATPNASGATVSWTTNVPTDTQVIYGLTTSYGSQTVLATALTTSHSAVINSLLPNTVYHYSVKSKDASNNLVQSPDKTFTTSLGGDTEVPSSPTALNATAVSSSQVNLTWTASTDNVGVAGYKVYKDGVLVGTVTTTSYQSTGLTAATTYSYTVKAFDATGNLSFASTPAPATTQAATVASTKFAVGDRVQVNNSSVNVRDAANGNLLGTQVLNALGSVIGGPIAAGGYSWWNINYDTSFDGWSAEDYLNKYAVPTTYTISVVKTVAGVSTPAAGTVTSSGGSINCGSVCSTPVASGFVVTLNATANSGYTFTGWSGGSCTGTGSCVTTVSSNVTVTAMFTSDTGVPIPAGDIDVTGGLKIWSGPGLSDTGDYYNIPISPLTIAAKYDKFVFYIKSNQSTGATGVTFFLSIQAGAMDPGTRSNIITLPGSYVVGGKVDTTWHQVVIPTSELVRAAATNLTFRKTPGTSIAVDNFYLVSTLGSRPAYQPLSSRVIRLQPPEAYDRASALNTSNYSLTDKTAGATISVTGVGRESELKGFVGPALLPDSNAPITAQYIYLVFGGDMVVGHQYDLIVNNIKTVDGTNYTKPEVISFTYADDQVNDTVKANQVGFLPSAHKYVYIGNYLGDYQEFGNMPIPTTPVCKLFGTSVTNPQSATPLATVTATDEGNDIDIGSHSTGSGTATHRYSMSGEHVYSCDFVGYQTPGSYYAYASNYGKSYPFDISPSVYNDVFKVAAKGLYFQRSSIALTAPYANGIHWGAGKSWARAAGSVYSDAHSIVHSSVWDNALADKVSTSPTYDAIHAVKDLSHGWYDAADYGKYVESGSGAIYELLTAYELNPGKYTDGQLTIPESGNGAPDILDEVKWELDWMKDMQSPNGFVYHKVATTNWGNVLPIDDTAPRWINEKSTAATLRYAAILAKASVDLRPYFPTEADVYLARAQKAYNAAYPGIGTAVNFGFNGGCAISGSTRPCNPPGDGSTLTFNGQTITEGSIGGGENGDSDNSDDERLWASAELFRATGNTLYNTNFQTVVAIRPLAVTWNAYGSDSLSRAGFTYARTPGANSSTVASYVASLQAFANDTVSNIRANTYHNGSYTTTNGNGWGAFSESSRWAWALAKAYELTKASNQTLANTYLDNAKIALDVQLGGNPLNKTFITGVGSNPPMKPLSTISSLDPQPDPNPGIPVYGIQNELTSNPWHNQVGAQTYPAFISKWDNYPIWRRYVDSSAIVDMGEFTIIDMGYTAAVFGYFSN